MQLLPKWVLPPTLPAIYDLESATALEQTAKVYGAMNALITEYNNFADSVNTALGTFTEEESTARAEFETKVTKLYREFTCQMDKYLRLNLDSTATKVIQEGMKGGTITVPTDKTLKLANYPADAAKTGAEIAVERARINNLVANPGTATEGNAELMDIRIGFDGTQYETAGEAVRTQVSELKDDLHDLQKGYAFDTSVLTESGYIETNGTEAEHLGFVRSYFLPINGQNKITIRTPITNFGSVVAFYSNNSIQSFIVGYQVLNDSNIDIVYEVPATAKYMRFSYAKGQTFYAYSSIEDIVGGKLKEKESYKHIYYMTSKIVLPTSIQRVKLIGDSITAGVGGSGYNTDGEIIYGNYQVNTSGTCWANMLKRNLENDYVAVNNFGVSGKKSCDLVENLSSIIHADDTLVICMIGTNDRVGTDTITGQDTTMQTLYNNLCTIKEYCESNGKDIIFMSGIPCVEGAEVNVHFRMEDVDKVYMKLSADYNIEYISMYKELKQYCQYTGKELGTLLTDGLHPTDYCYEVMFDIISRKLGLPARITVAPL